MKMHRKLAMPQAREDRPAYRMQWEVAPCAMERWTPDLMAAAGTDNTISVLDPIGVDPWSGEGVTAKRISAALRSIGADKDVVVNVNSPGGDMFEGLAIYNLLREHKGKVTVKVLGLAASAASIIAMAGDELQVARAGFLMIHNTWAVVVGNRLDLREMADMLDPFDAAMADIYSARTGIDAKAISKLMNQETWINGSLAVDQGFADALLPADDVKKNLNAQLGSQAEHDMEVSLAKLGMPRSERRKRIQDMKSRLTGTLRAAEGGTPCAAAELVDFINQYTIHGAINGK